MAKKQILFGKEARHKIRIGATKIAAAVRATMGARGRLVGTSYGHFTKDGVTVARDIELEDPFENKGAQLVKDAAIKTCDVVGDGTTATCVLASEFINEGFDLLDRGKDAQELRREIENVKPLVLKALDAMSENVKNVVEVASISANDEKIGKVVAEAVNAVGQDGLVTIENSYSPNDEVEVVDGMQIDQGVKFPVFYTNPNRKRSEYTDPIVVIYDGDINDVQGFFTMLTPAFQQGKAVVVIADAFDDQVMYSMGLNRLQHGVKIVPITAPHIYREEVLEDIAVYTGARVLKQSDSLIDTDINEVCGHAASVVAMSERTIIRSNGKQDKEVKKRIAYIKEHAKEFKEDERREVEKRNARLLGKVAIIRTHSTTEEEAKEKRDRFDDAIFAAQAALKEGVVVGGGMTYLKIADSLKDTSDGARLVKRVLEAPIRQIALNAGRSTNEVISKAREGHGYNARTDEFGDLKKMGVIDPVAVLKHAFENALSVSVLALTTEALVHKIDEKAK